MERYNFKDIENKWQTFWEKNNSFKTETNKIKKILLFRNVSLPIRKIIWSCQKLYNWRCISKIQEHARI